ncbi:MAG: hypothetical protein H0W74_09915 [Sphingosinicella sp.]|nr:hypothetical protein [Sphingosinicella sp.]
MLKMLSPLVTALSICLPTAALAQGEQSETPMILTSATDNVLRAGTPIVLKMAEGLTTKGKKLRVGQRFQMEVAEPVMVNNQIVIAAGSPATGEVTHVRNKGMWGKSGGINAQLLFVRANGRQIRITGQMDDKGKTGTAGVVGALVVVPIAGFFVTGTSAEIPLGAPVKGFIDEDLTVAFGDAAPAMVVPTATPQQ